MRRRRIPCLPNAQSTPGPRGTFPTEKRRQRPVTSNQQSMFRLATALRAGAGASSAPGAHRVLVYGSSGALGRQLVSAFRARAKANTAAGESQAQQPWVAGVDFSPNPECDLNIVLDAANGGSDPENQRQVVLQALREEQRKLAGRNSAEPEPLLNSVLCVAGGWAGGGADSGDLLVNTRNMISASVYASLICAHVASPLGADSAGNSGTDSAGHGPLLKGGASSQGSLLLLPGAAPLLLDPKANPQGGKKTTQGSSGAIANTATGFMLPYGVAKAGVHQLLESLSSGGADAVQTGDATAGVQAGVRCVGIAPITLDTPMNRSGMPDADFGSWTPLEHLAEQIVSWSYAPQTAEHGKMYLVKTEGGRTEFL